MDYRDAPPEAFDAISSIGLTEHIGVRSYGRTSAPSPTGCVPAGGCSTTASPGRTTTRRTGPAPFIDRYVFPDGELAGPGRA